MIRMCLLLIGGLKLFMFLSNFLRLVMRIRCDLILTWAGLFMNLWLIRVVFLWGLLLVMLRRRALGGLSSTGFLNRLVTW